jgi:hypothetical protein
MHHAHVMALAVGSESGVCKGKAEVKRLVSMWAIRSVNPAAPIAALY